MKRHVFTILSAVSLLLFVAAVGTWVRSYFVSDVVRLDVTRWHDLGGDHEAFQWRVGRGGIGLLKRTWTYRRPPGGPPAERSDRRAGPFHEAESARHPGDIPPPGGWLGRPWSWKVVGFGYVSGPAAPPWIARGAPGPTARATAVWVPLWAVAAIAGVLPVLWLRAYWVRRRRLWRARRGLCLACGYDLRASTESCPECGEPIRSIIVE